MGKDTIVDIITSIRNVEMNRKGTVLIPSTNITENLKQTKKCKGDFTFRIIAFE